MKQFFADLLSDKSFWAALAALLSCILVALNVPQGSIGQLTSFLGGLGTMIAYMIQNGILQAAQTKADAQVKAAEAVSARKGGE